MRSSEDQLPEVLQDTATEAEWATHLSVIMTSPHIRHNKRHSLIVDGGEGVVSGGLVGANDFDSPVYIHKVKLMLLV